MISELCCTFDKRLALETKETRGVLVETFDKILAPETYDTSGTLAEALILEDRGTEAEALFDSNAAESTTD